MKKPFFGISLTLLVCFFLLTVLIDSAGAQGSISTPTSLPNSTLSITPTLASTSTSSLPSEVTRLANSDIATFSDFHQSEIQLDGPYASSSFSFAIPADWALKDGIQLDLLLGVSFNSGPQAQGDVVVVGGGTLTVLLNNIVLLVKPLNEVGEIDVKIDIPLSYFTSNRSDGRMALRFILQSGLSCRFVGLDTTVYIHPTSYFNFPHDLTQPPTSLINFPRPIFQNSFFPDSALLVIPDQPTAAELQAALTVAAGLGNLSSNRLILDMITLSNLKDDLAKNHLIFIGKSSSLPVLGGFKLPLPPVNGQFQFSDGSPDDGLIEMINSPWSASHNVLVVSANTDSGVVKAAQAVSSGIIRPNRFENLAVIEQVNSLPVSGPQAIDQTLSSLGYEFQSFQQERGEAREDYLFNVPADMTITAEAYFDMVYGHSSLMDYNASQIVVLLNDQPIGSVRMNDGTAVLPTNHAKIMIPPAAVLPGSNRLSVVVALEPVTDCDSLNSTGLWVNIWPQSLIHLPLTDKPLDSVIYEDLATYPTPFIYDSTLRSTAFVLEHDDPESWRNAVQIATFLGSQASGPLTQFSVFYGDEMPVTERSKYQILLIGRPSQMPLVSEMNEYLPAPFLDGGDTVSENSSFQVTYQIPPDSPMGYIETMLSPWNSENVVLAILGNTTQGVGWAAMALVDSTLRGQLNGNFAVVNNKQIISSDTRYVDTSSIVIPVAENPNAIATSPGETTTYHAVARPGWILPVILVSIGLIVLIVAIVAIRNKLLNSVRKSDEAKGKNGDDNSQSQS